MAYPRPAAIALILMIAITYSPVSSAQQRITLTGKLTRAVAIGGETTGWLLELKSPANIEGKQLTSIQITYRKAQRLEALKDKYVVASGQIFHRHGVETGDQPVLKVSSINAVTDGSQEAAESNGTFELTGTEWRLDDLAGTPVIENSQATLAFPEAGRIAGNDSCNRFFGTSKIHQNTVHLSPLGATRMACPDAIMDQEKRYLQVLQSAERFEWKDPYLLIYCSGFDQPLRFTRIEAKPSAPQAAQPRSQ